MRAIPWSSLPERIRHGNRRQYLGAVGVMGVGLAVLAVLYMGQPVFIIPILIAVAIVVIVTLRQPVYGFLAVVAALYLPLTIGDYTLFQMVGVVVAALILVFIAVTRKGLVLSNVVPPILLFALLTVNSLTFTQDTGMTYYLVRKLAFNALFCLILVNLLDDFRKLRLLLGLIVSMALLNSAVAIFQFVGGGHEEARAKGLQENENQLGEVSAWSLVIIIYLFLYSKTRRQQIVSMILGVIVASGLVASISRAAVLALLAGLAWMTFREGRYRRRFVVMAVMIAAVAPFLPGAFYRRFENVNDAVRGTLIVTGRTGLTDRGYFNRAGLKIWRAHPIVGVGLGNFGFYYIRPEFNPGFRGYRNLPPHNIYVQALAETGTLGFLVLMLWIFQVARNYWVAGRSSPEDPMDIATTRACETITLVALIIYITSGNIVYTNFAMIMAVSYACRRGVAAARSQAIAPRGVEGRAA